MSYRTLMVHMETGHANTGILKLAGDLARRCEAEVIGIAASQSVQMIYGEVYISGEIIEQARAELEQDIHTAELEFRAALEPRVRVKWRSALTTEPLAQYLAREARAADLLVAGVDRKRSIFDSARHVNIGDLVMQAGRPVMIVPEAADHLALNRVVVFWKDSRETRRALVDSLPLLKLADHVCLVQVAGDSELGIARADLEDVAAWMKRHGVSAECLALPSGGDDALRLDDIALEQRADLVVAGAYGHGRAREWALGGVTRDLLLRGNRCALVSH